MRKNLRSGRESSQVAQGVAGREARRREQRTKKGPTKTAGTRHSRGGVNGVGLKSGLHIRKEEAQPKQKRSDCRQKRPRINMTMGH